MPWVAPHYTAPQRFALLIEEMCRHTMARIGERVPAPLAWPMAMLICALLRRVGGRFAAIVARMARGGPKQRKQAATAAPRPGQAPPPPSRFRHLPRRFGWMIFMVPYASTFRTQFAALLDDAEMKPFLTVRGTARALRPLCQMLGVPAAAVTPPEPAAPIAARDGADEEAVSAATAASAPRPHSVLITLPRLTMRTPFVWPSLESLQNSA